MRKKIVHTSESKRLTGERVKSSHSTVDVPVERIEAQQSVAAVKMFHPACGRRKLVTKKTYVNFIPHAFMSPTFPCVESFCLFHREKRNYFASR